MALRWASPLTTASSPASSGRRMTARSRRLSQEGVWSPPSGGPSQIGVVTGRPELQTRFPPQQCAGKEAKYANREITCASPAVLASADFFECPTLPGPKPARGDGGFVH